MNSERIINIYKHYGYDGYDDFFIKSSNFMNTICYDFVSNTIELIKESTNKNMLYGDFYNNIYKVVKTKPDGENFIKCLIHIYISEQIKIMLYDVLTFYNGDMDDDITIINCFYNFVFESEYISDVYNELCFNIISDSLVNYIAHVNELIKHTSDKLNNSNDIYEKFKNATSPSKYDN